MEGKSIYTPGKWLDSQSFYMFQHVREKAQNSHNVKSFKLFIILWFVNVVMNVRKNIKWTELKPGF